MPALVSRNERHKTRPNAAAKTLKQHCPKLKPAIKFHHLAHAQTPKHITVPCFDAFSKEPKQICIPTFNVYIYVMGKNMQSTVRDTKKLCVPVR